VKNVVYLLFAARHASEEMGYIPLSRDHSPHSFLPATTEDLGTALRQIAETISSQSYQEV